MITTRDNHVKLGEFKLLNDFLSSDFFYSNFARKNCQLSIIQEPFTGFGYADLVCVAYDKSIGRKWCDKRNSLKTHHIKVLHHLFNCAQAKRPEQLAVELGFNSRKIGKILEDLLNAGLVTVAKDVAVKIRPLKDIFFVKDIITVEAKLLDWRKALEQSLNNINFSSRSYTLFPESTISDSLLHSYKKTGVGLISFKNSWKELLEPEEFKIPATIHSWFFNEYIGRQIALES